MSFKENDRIAVRGYSGTFVVVCEVSPGDLVRCYPVNLPHLVYEFPKYKITRL